MKNNRGQWNILWILAFLATARPAAALSAPYGIERRSPTPPYLGVAGLEQGQFPPQLSQIGAFQDTARLVPSPLLIPYQLNVPFFSDDAVKSRWVSIPDSSSGKAAPIGFSAAGEWKFPPGTVFIKHFELGTDESAPAVRRRLETRLLVVDSDGGIQVATYKWRSDGSDAELLSTNLTESIPIRTSSGERMQTWNYPGRQDCRTCHTDLNGGVLGVKTRQLNGPMTYPGGITDNQLRTWNHLGLFGASWDESTLATLPALACLTNTSLDLTDRARSYLDANCSHCHRPGGTVGNFDARYETPLARQNLIDGPVLIDQGVDRARVVVPRDIWRSILYVRASTLEGMKMPPIAHERLDGAGLGLLRDWINSLPGTPALPPPEIMAASSASGGRTEIVIRHFEPGVRIHYTTDGSAPGPSDSVYDGPIPVDFPAVIRARAYKTGFNRSIAAQEFFQSSK